MPPFEPGSGKNKEPVNMEDYDLVRQGKGTPEQVARVRSALANEYSPLYLELGDRAPWRRIHIERKYATPVPMHQDVWPAHKNFLTVCAYLREKQLAGVLSEQEVRLITDSTRPVDVDSPGSSPTRYAMCVSRMKRAIIRLRPDLAIEVKNLPMSRDR